MPRLILIRHSQPQIDPARPASQWPLSEEGRRRCEVLAPLLAAHAPAAIVTSTEPKAAETGAILAARLGLPCATAEGLHEHRRERVGWTSAEVFERSIADFFARPDDLVFGEETANGARGRFERAVGAVLDQHAEETVAVVAHGTVIALFVAAHAGASPLPFWRGLGMPALVVLSLPAFRLIEQAAIADRMTMDDGQ